MKITVIRSLASLVLLAASAHANANTWTANFNSPTLDPSLTLSSSSTDWTVTSGNGVLDFSSAGNSATTASRSVQYSPVLNGDFTARVMVDISQSYNVIGFLSFSGPTGSLLNTNIAAYRVNSPTDTGHIGGFNPVTNSFPPNLHGVSPLLTFEINRTGDVFTQSFKSPGDSSFTPFFSFDGSVWHGIGGAIFLSARQNVAAATAANVKFSNFTVMTPVPEPDAWALLLAGFGMMSFFARRHCLRRAAA